MIDLANIPRYHVFPLDDLREHETNDHTSCWCHPTLTEDGYILHHSMDGREDYESGKRRLC